MTRQTSPGRPDRPGVRAWRRGLGLAAGLGIFALCVSGASAHEQNHTHAGLTEAAFEVLDDPKLRADDTDVNALASLVQGVKDEDICPRYNSHFFNPKTGLNTISAPAFDPNCGIGVPPGEGQTTAPDRARRLWDDAVAQYRAGNRGEAYHTLGQVMHLLQDMTSPSHVHNNPHGKALQTCSQDDDDFENWGWCERTPDSLSTRHIRDYWDDSEPVISNRMTERLETALERLFVGQPQFVTPGPGEHVAVAYVRRVANIVYDFTTFSVLLVDRKIGSDTQPNSALKRMFPDLFEDPLGGWRIGLDALGPSSLVDNIGHTAGNCGRSEGLFDILEEWWPMENPGGGEDGSQCTIERNFLGQKLEVRALAFIENVGGEGDSGLGVRDSLVPLRYEKFLYQTVYGTQVNTRNEFNQDDGDTSCSIFFNLNPAAHDDDDDCPKTMLRIYGDVLYPVAVVYGAGLLREFVDAVKQPPVAVAGGPYIGEMCQPVTFDASASFDPDGEIVEYAWDFDWRGNPSEPFDETTISPQIDHTYFQEFIGLARLRVTDDDALTDNDVAGVRIGPDGTPPAILAMTTNMSSLWPPNHKMIPVALTVVADDACDPDPQCQIVFVTSNEPINGRGDGNTTPDWEMTGDLTLDLRAERSGKGSGRVYTIAVQCSDDFGNSASADMPLEVPHSMGKSKFSAVRQ